MAEHPESGEQFDGLITGANLRQYFQHTVDDALATRGVDAAVETVYYIVNLLTAYQRADRLYEQTGAGFELKPLALIYAEALEIPQPEQRQRVVQRLGDLALFIAGVFSESLRRKPVDVDYYIAMGSGAYGYLSEAMRGTARGRAFCAVFNELSSKFAEFVAALGQVSDGSALRTNTDILRLYDLWLRTGSRRAEQRLRELGIGAPAMASASVSH
jgi:hypothetical protein